MRVEVGKAIKVGPGDILVVRGTLAPDSKVNRLYVFAKEGEAQFSPYIENLRDKLAMVSDKPQMYTPMSLRLDGNRPQHEISFIADFDGWIRVMQEIDRADDIRAVVRIQHKVNPYLPWRQRLARKLSSVLPDKLSGMLSWNH